jgi:hypothetical protein
VPPVGVLPPPTQELLKQVCPVGQAIPQPPQFAPSVWVFTQLPPQLVEAPLWAQQIWLPPGPVQLLLWHWLLEVQELPLGVVPAQPKLPPCAWQVCPPPQLTLQTPQLGLALMLMQVLPQFPCPVGQQMLCGEPPPPTALFGLGGVQVLPAMQSVPREQGLPFGVVPPPQTPLAQVWPAVQPVPQVPQLLLLVWRSTQVALQLFGVPVVGQQTLVAPPLGDGAVQTSPVTHCELIVQVPFVGVLPTQAPPLQICPERQGLPQAPQFAAFVCVSTQAPLQLVGVLVVGQQMLPVVVLPGPGATQASPFTHCGDEVQGLPLVTVPAQIPLMQLAPPAQALPQLPQFVGVVRSVQVPLQLPLAPVVGQQTLVVPVLPELGAAQMLPLMH